MHEKTLRVGVDVGGTFTDLVALDEHRNVTFHKVPSTPDDPSRAIVSGICELLELGDAGPSSIEYLGHGTTVATNMIIERAGARCALLTTRGFRDVLEIGRQTRPHLYDYRVRRPAPVVRRALRLEIDERVGADGEVLSPLQMESVELAIDVMRRADVMACAICFLHSYTNGTHERLVAQAVAAALPHVFVSCSRDVVPEFREFERTSTTALNAYVGPIMGHYIKSFVERLTATGIDVAPFTMQSSGGLMSVQQVVQAPVRTCLSGPAAGVVGAAALGRAMGLKNLLTFDVGGTSTDVSLVVDGQPATTVERDVAGHPVRSPMIDVHVVGAGGGSIARVDTGGSLKVGPRSAGAHPGPVAYGQGGLEVTLTDANLVLGRLSPDGLLRGRMPLDSAAAEVALKHNISDQLGLELAPSAMGVIDVAVANIARAIRAVTSVRDVNLEGLPLLSLGGAGPLHAIAVAREVGLRRVIVPQEPGTACAHGMLLTDLRQDYVRSLVQTGSQAAWSIAIHHLSELKAEAGQWLEGEGIPDESASFITSVDTRYEGQSFEVPVPLDCEAGLEFSEFAAKFHAVHKELYGYAIPERAITLVNCRLQALGTVNKAPLKFEQLGAGDAPAPTSVRSVYLNEEGGWRSCAVYARESLCPGVTLPGPLIVEEMSSTSFIGATDMLCVDGFGNLDITLGESV